MRESFVKIFVEIYEICTSKFTLNKFYFNNVINNIFKSMYQFCKFAKCYIIYLRDIISFELIN